MRKRFTRPEEKYGPEEKYPVPKRGRANVLGDDPPDLKFADFPEEKKDPNRPYKKNDGKHMTLKVKERHIKNRTLKKHPKGKKKKDAANPDDPTCIFNPCDGFAQMYVLVGKSLKGKSHFVKWLVYHKFGAGKPKWKFGLVFVRTKFNHGYNFLPENSIVQGYDQDVLERYVEQLEKIIASEGSVGPNFIIFDDLVGILSNQNQWFINWISTHRHFNTNVVIAVQYLTGKNAISPIMREQTSVAMLFNSKTRRTVENLYESYGQLFPTLREFQDYYQQATAEPYVCMVYMEHEDDIHKNYLRMRAPAKHPTYDIEYKAKQ